MRIVKLNANSEVDFELLRRQGIPHCYDMDIQIDGYNINYKITGQGDKYAVILQGWGTKMEYYDTVAAAINSEYKVVQFDLPGFGRSDEPKEPWNLDAYSEFFCKFLAELGISETTLIGHSYGGRMIIKMASRASLPFKIRNIVLIDSAGVIPIRTFKQKCSVRKYKILKKLLDNKVVYTLFPEVVDEWKSRQGSADYRNASPVMKKCMVMAINEDLTDKLPLIKQDTLLIWGDKDTATPMRDAKIMEEKIPNSGLVVLEGAGHFSYIEQPEKFRNVMRVYFGIGDRNGNN